MASMICLTYLDQRDRVLRQDSVDARCEGVYDILEAGLVLGVLVFEVLADVVHPRHLPPLSAVEESNTVGKPDQVGSRVVLDVLGVLDRRELRLGRLGGLAGDADTHDEDLVPEISDGGVEQTLTGATRIHRQDASHALDQVLRLPLRPDPLHQAGNSADRCDRGGRDRDDDAFWIAQLALTQYELKRSSRGKRYGLRRPVAPVFPDPWRAGAAPDPSTASAI
ncbi:hypothetical protein [Streptomyces sp. NBC_01176]|uniref:hypothetical protein n=1 Tax=Streptomyces sp. NBC_01176 TaxID=2903760 RepID=UPI003865CDD3|nr:hypothetical protein OG199_43705 [Streptomyces sp. NBC_01176]